MKCATQFPFNHLVCIFSEIKLRFSRNIRCSVLLTGWRGGLLIAKPDRIKGVPYDFENTCPGFPLPNCNNHDGRGKVFSEHCVLWPYRTWVLLLLLLLLRISPLILMQKNKLNLHLKVSYLPLSLLSMDNIIIKAR